MTKKEKETKEDKTTPKKSTADKLILFEAVHKHDERKYIVLGALANDGLIKQYYAEELQYGVEDIEPSITMNELDKIVKNFKGR